MTDPSPSFGLSNITAVGSVFNPCIPPYGVHTHANPVDAQICTSGQHPSRQPSKAPKPCRPSPSISSHRHHLSHPPLTSTSSLPTHVTSVNANHPKDLTHPTLLLPPLIGVRSCGCVDGIINSIINSIIDVGYPNCALASNAYIGP
jgi:hypothetical protein